MQGNEPFDITINWSSQVDLDLCVFYRSCDGEEGGVFSDEFRSNSSDLGCLGAYPYMQHMGDAKEPLPGRIGSETVKVGRPDNFERLDVVVINYNDAIDLLDVNYSDPAGNCMLGEREITASPQGHGQAYHVATMRRDAAGVLQTTEVNKVLPLREAYETIPGFALICE